MIALLILGFLLLWACTSLVAIGVYRLGEALWAMRG